jgi:GNAT superfamily N-acetyltransferase
MSVRVGRRWWCRQDAAGWSPTPEAWERKQVDGLHGLARLSFVTANLQIRPGSAAHLAALVAALGQRDFFVDRLARQHQGRGVLLVAWLGDRPVGDLYLLREPADVPKVRRHLPGVPQLHHLEVVAPLQRRGIGTALIGAGEDTARWLGDEQLALGVGLANIHARRLYERLGYVDWGHGPVVGTWRAVRDDGIAVAVSQLIDMLVKHL